MKSMLISLALVASTAHAGFWNGNELLSRLNNEHSNPSQYLQAQGYILGVVDAGDGEDFCIPANVNGGQIFDIVRNFLRDKPEMRHQFKASLFVWFPLKQAFPCKEGGGA